MGKFLACVSIYAIANAPLFIFQTIVSYYAASNWLQFLYSVLGTLLLGSTLIAIGIFISSITESTALAAVLSVVANIVIMFISQIFQIIGIEWLTKITSAIALLDRFTSFSESILKVEDIVYYLTVIAFFVFLSVRSVEKRRWA
jgi:ABC-2 type transport system permease protein